MKLAAVTRSCPLRQQDKSSTISRCSALINDIFSVPALIKQTDLASDLCSFSILINVTLLPIRAVNQFHFILLKPDLDLNLDRSAFVGALINLDVSKHCDKEKNHEIIIYIQRAMLFKWIVHPKPVLMSFQTHGALFART